VPSKAALVTALQARAVATLRASYATVQATWAAVLDEAGHGSDPALEPGLRALVELCAFSAHWIAASVVLADEFRLQRTLLTERTSGAAGADETREVLAAVDALLAVPTGLLDAAATAGVLRPGSARERALRWVAALNGVLLLDQLSPLDRHLFRAAPLARQLSDDLLRGWGAADADLDVADVHVQRLAARGPMAPPPGAPSPGPA
jgi:hypothetical protein